MIKFNDLVNGLSKILKTNFQDHKVYTEEIKQGLERPCFHILTIPLTSNNFNQYYREQQCLIDISYFSSEQSDLQSNLTNLEMSNKLQTVLNTELKVLDRDLNIQELQFETIERVLHTTFTLIWYNENEVTKAYLDSHVVMEHFTVTFDGFCYEYLVTSTGEVFKTTNGQFYVKCTDAEIILLRDRNKIVI